MFRDRRARVAAIVVLLGAIAYLTYRCLPRDEPEPTPAEPPPAVAEEQADPVPVDGPRHPVPGAEPGDGPLPSLAESDGPLTEALVRLIGADNPVVAGLRQDLIRRTVAIVDSLPRSTFAERMRPVERLEGQLRITGPDDAGRYLLSPANYERYDVWVDVVAGIDPSAAARLYRSHYPLFQEAYEELGYPDGYFNDRLVEVLDHLLATPEVTDPVYLVQPKVAYRFADPSVEALSYGQKLLIRIGPRNRARVKEVLRALRAEVAR